ncbi:MAG: OmpA family protein [Allosphingosinicella sp.]
MRLLLGLRLVAAAAALAAGASPAGACVAGSALVMFDAGSAELGPEAQGILDAAASSFLGQGGSGRYRLIGHSDRAGSAAANLRLSRRRAEAVRDYLAAHGIPLGLMDVAAAGEAGLPVATPDGAAEPRNRFVEVRPLPGGEDGARRDAEIRSGRPIPVC